MDIQDVLMMASAECVREVVPSPRGVEFIRYRLPDYPYAGAGDVLLYAVCDQGEVLFVDCGPANMTDKSWFSQIIDSRAESVDQATLFMTHCHFDHVGEAGWMGRQGVRCLIGQGSDAYRSMDSEACKYAFGSVGYDLPFGVEAYCRMQEELWASMGEVQSAQNWDLLTVGDRKFEIMPLPGHAPGHCGVVSKDKTLLFSGDCLCRNPSVYSWELDKHDAAVAIETWSGLMAYPLEWVATAHEGFLEGEEEIKGLIRDQIDGVNARAKSVLQILRDMGGYKTVCDFLVELKGAEELIAAPQRATYLNALRLCHYLAYMEFLYDYEQVCRHYDDNGCAIYEPARFASFFA